MARNIPILTVFQAAYLRLFLHGEIMDRPIVYQRAIPLETDMLNASRDGMVALGWAMQSVLGASTCLSGLACSPTSPASLGIQIGAGAIYSLQSLEATAYSSLDADTLHTIVKQGLSLDPVLLACPAPATPGFSVVYLVQAAYQDQDIDPNSSGIAQSIQRKGVCVLSLKAGTPVATGTQSAPTADAGFVGLYAVTVAYGQASVSVANIAKVSGAPFLTETLTQKISQATADARYFLASSAGALATMGIGAGLENDGSANLRVKNPVNAKTAQTSYSFAATDRAALVRRSNGGVAMTDVLPGAGSGILPASWSTSVVNNDLSASLTINVGAGGGQIDGGSSLVVPAGASVVISSDGQNYWSERGLSPLGVFPAGTVVHFAGTAAPAGWLKANGALVSRTTYSGLFAVIGTSFGAGDGTASFALPDLRGEFIRGFDDGRGIDAGRVIGSWQVDMFGNHFHDLGMGPTGASGSTSWLWDALHNSGTNSGATGGSETRPRNIALLACIKY
jgi:microcystin-dependent protein